MESDSYNINEDLQKNTRRKVNVEVDICMLAIVYKKYGIRIGHSCFFNEESILEEEYRKIPCDILYMYGLKTNLTKGYFLNDQHTLMKNLSPDDNEIFMTLGSHLRKHIRKCKSNKDVEISFFDSEQLKNRIDILKVCRELFQKMYASKGKTVSFNELMANALIEEKNLCIGLVEYKKVPIGFSAVILKGDCARRWISAFDFRNNKEEAQIYSDAHKLLDWEMMLWCKRQGALSIDLGGVNSFEAPNGIAKFKLDFEKDNKITYSNYMMANSLIGKVVILYLKNKKVLAGITR